MGPNLFCWQILFSVYINDLPSAINCNCELFADDSVLHRIIAKVGYCHRLQEDISRTSRWCSSWIVILESEKCKVLHISKLKMPINHQYILNNHNLPAVKHHKHLGIWLDSSLSWDYHINSIYGKANRILGLIRRTFGPEEPGWCSNCFQWSGTSNAGVWLSGVEPSFGEAC